MKKGVLLSLLVILILAVSVLNYFLWKSKEAKLHRVEGLKAQVGLHVAENQRLKDRNGTLMVDVDNLRSPNAYYIYEEKARENYGLIGQNETFFVLPDRDLLNLPDIPGLGKEAVGEEADNPQPDISSNNKAVPQPKTISTKESISVAPIPLQLESLQE